MGGGEWPRPSTLAPPGPSLAPIGPASMGPPLRTSRHIKAPRPGRSTSTCRWSASARPSWGTGRGTGGRVVSPQLRPGPLPHGPDSRRRHFDRPPLPPSCDYSDTRCLGPTACPVPANHPGAAPVTSASSHFCPRKGFTEVSEAMLGRGRNVPGSPGRAGGGGGGGGRPGGCCC